MSDTGDIYREMRERDKAARRKYSVACPWCIDRYPKRNPTKLMPGRRCKMDGYRDNRRLADVIAASASCGICEGDGCYNLGSGQAVACPCCGVMATGVMPSSGCVFHDLGVQCVGPKPCQVCDEKAAQQEDTA